VLIYLLLAEHAIEIVADRGIDRMSTPQVARDRRSAWAARSAKAASRTA
jgi:uncharacterized membrane protein